MAIGINLVHTLGAPAEGGWAFPAEEYYLQAFKDAGFKHVRIPVTWDKHIAQQPPYNIDNAFLDRVEQIVDWHSHHADEHTKQAVQFFKEIAQKYHHYPNIIYEIYNEPLNNTDWSTAVKPYAEQVIDSIRTIDKNNLILVGTQTWSQDVDKAAQDPLVGYHNIAYSLHFYAGTHKHDIRLKAQKALDAGLALFVSEWGTVNANGDGAIDKESTEQWLSFIKKNSLSHCSWSVTNKNEASAILKPSTSSLGPWQDNELTANGKYLKSIIKNWQQ